MKILVLLLLVLSTMSSAFARADVSLKNGNFFMTFRHLGYTGGLAPAIEAVYNSKSDFRTGMFGYSWGVEYETALKVELDGSVLVNEFGGGAQNRFTPKGYQEQSLANSVDQILGAARKAGVVTSPAQVATYRERLVIDADYRTKQYYYYVGKGLLNQRKIAEGTQLVSTRYFYQYITKVKGGYVRVLEGGNIQKFNDSGKLVQISDRNKNMIQFSYDSTGHLVAMEDNFGRKMKLTYNVKGHVEKIEGDGGKSAVFKYSSEGLLSYAKDENGVENTFQYTADNFRNLREIGFPGKKDSDGKSVTKKMLITYYPPDKNMSVKSVQNTDGTMHEYEYFFNPARKDYYAVKVKLKNAAGTELRSAKHEYFTKSSGGGEPFVWKLVSDENGDVTETLYHPKLGFPEQVKINGKVTKMTYDAKGRILKKVTPTETVVMAYHPTLGKLTKLNKTLKSGTQIWSEFAYDVGTGNLLTAKNSDKKSVKIVYDPAGRMKILIDQTGKQLTFKYNDQSKPIEITDAKAGSIKLLYKNNGEIDKVEGNGGSATASEVLRAISNLSDITAPAGLSLSI